MSISGQAVVFVVRTISWSPIAMAGKLTYIAFVLAQVRFTRARPASHRSGAPLRLVTLRCDAVCSRVRCHMKL